MLFIKGQGIDVDYLEELEQFLDKFEKHRVRDNKLQSCSPFRQERRPSFAVNLDTGVWVDSGASTEEMRKGSFLSLLMYLREESYEETVLYLLEKYGRVVSDTKDLALNISLPTGVKPGTWLAEEKYIQLIDKPHKYLLSRGIGVEVQRKFNCGVSQQGDAIVLPWHDKNGRIINCKYRAIDTKNFWYSSGGKPVKHFVYGLFAVKELHREQTNRADVWLVESEIDALYLWENGFCAIAFGGSSISEQQKKLILNNLEGCSLVLATDNDTVGNRFRGVLFKELGGHFNIKVPIFPENKKDVNEFTKQELFLLSRNLKPLTLEITL